jgi:hypothetical protein
VHHQIFAGDEELDYAFMGTNPAAPDNVWLREAAERQIPLICSAPGQAETAPGGLPRRSARRL